MIYKPGMSYYKEFTTSNPASGAACNADTLPIASARWNNADDAAFVLTVTFIDTGRYIITGTVPVGYSAGNVVNILVVATVTGIVTKAVVDTFCVDTALANDNATAIAAIPTTPLLAANYTTPPTVAAIRTEMDVNSTKLDSVYTDVAAIASQVSSLATPATVWEHTTRVLTDKSGFSLSTAGILAIWNQATAAGGILVNTFGAKLRDLIFGTDNKVMISADAQDLSATLDVNAKTVGDKTGYVLTAAYDAAKTSSTQTSVDAIPVTPLLTADTRLNYLNASIAAIPTTPLLAANYTAPDNTSIGTILTAIQSATYGLSRLDTEIDAITTALGSVALNADIQTLLTRLTNARGLLIDNLQYLTAVPGITSGQAAILTEARDEAKLSRKHRSNKAERSLDGLTVTIYDDDDVTPLWVFSIPNARTRIPIR